MTTSNGDMHYKPYPDSFWKTLETYLENHKDVNHELIAAFDADGTLWDCDLGENFFQYQIDHKLIPLPDQPFEHYLKLKKVDNDPRMAFAWLAQINKGVPVEQVRKWTQKAFNEIKPNPVFSEQKKLIELLNRYEIKSYIVTASIKWAVEAGAVAVGIPPERVIGVETEIQNDLITDIVKHPITYRQGKVDALKIFTQNKVPFLCSGNTMGDFELLSCASQFRLVVSAASLDERNYATELQLIQAAKNNNWFHHRFI